METGNTKIHSFPDEFLKVDRPLIISNIEFGSVEHTDSEHFPVKDMVVHEMELVDPVGQVGGMIGDGQDGKPFCGGLPGALGDAGIGVDTGQRVVMKIGDEAHGHPLASLVRIRVEMNSTIRTTKMSPMRRAPTTFQRKRLMLKMRGAPIPPAPTSPRTAASFMLRSKR